MEILQNPIPPVRNGPWMTRRSPSIRMLKVVAR
jgi:hypothetical protein